jgi:hypothetical protein
MSKGKRYYWMKLKEGFMTSDTVDYFMSQPNGANYVVLYQMLCLKTINTGGRLARQIGEIMIPFDVDKIQRDCKWFSVDTVRIALNLYKSFGLIYEDVDGMLVLADHQNLVGSETDYAVQKRIQRQGNTPPLLKEGEEDVDIVHQVVHTENRDKIEEEREEEKEKEYSFIHSVADGNSEKVENSVENREEAKRRYLQGSLGKGVVFLSDEQMDDLLDCLSIEEFNHYVTVVADCELNGKPYKRKTHYQAIKDMAIKDRKIR